MTIQKNFKLSMAAIAASLLVAACGGGGGGGGSSDASPAAPASGASTPATTTPANLTTPQYPADSFHLAAFNLLNQQRQQCGFPALQENTVLDQAAAAHAQYQATNNVVSDFETAGATGFTGATYADRAAHFGYPQNTGSVGVSGGIYTNATWSETKYGEQAIFGLISGVYHIDIAVAPTNSIGIGKVATTYNGYPQVWHSMTLANYQPVTSNTPLTFPCQGTTGVSYYGGGEIPTPPATSGNWGTPVAVAGNPTDTIVMQTGTMTDSSSHVIALQVLDSATDPNKILPKWMGVAYPATPLSPNSQYTVSLTGTINGVAFARTFTFTTGNIVS
ncbi:CAP domain-containing protein [Caballeronia novacaledonica]|uniref:CAP domain-containing protein n=2 Tax=Caballeronia novacaledonica TaxID=1544861 RepID=A0ACB5QRU9_9BURK|nr:CAP domain-containing protein [Caballeronia novacaledonica]KXV06393.1 serine protease [Caballeronia megalochromosomata]GJH17447.1 CAP domain-containing protein [Caballeronia novacaledonica]GJH30668.1 CAP domain-containing protein [Caballeronia novacaledonica]